MLIRSLPRYGLVVLALVLGCHRGIESNDGAGDQGTGQSSESGASEGTSGLSFDITPWVGSHHYEDPFHPFGEANPIQGSSTLANISIMGDFTAQVMVDSCESESPLEYRYRVSPLDQNRVQLLPLTDSEPLRYLAGTNIDAVEAVLDELCGTLSVEVKGGLYPDEFTPVDSWKPGAACWVDKCTGVSPMGETTFQIDYCDGEEPEGACQ